MNWDFEYWNALDDAQQAAFLARYSATLESGYQWSKTTISYSFPTFRTGLEYTSYVPAGEILRFVPLNSDEQAFVRFYFSYIESFLNLDFREVSGSAGDIVIGQHNMDVGGYANLPDNFGPSGVFLSSDAKSSEYGDFAYTVLAHEIGHALGLDHTRPYDGDIRANPGLPVAYDTSLMSVMTYSDVTPISPVKYVSTLMPLDIAALMEMYGARPSLEANVFRVVDGYEVPTLAGNVWTISGNVPFTVVDTGGFDTIDASGFHATAGVQFIFDEGLWLTPENPFNQLSYYINASDRPWVDLTGQTDGVPMIGLYAGTVIEKFIGSAGDDYVYGNERDQTADGGAGTDTYYLSGDQKGYAFSVEAGTGDIIVTDTYLADGDDGTDRLVNFELVSFGGKLPVTLQSIVNPTLWYTYHDDVAMVAATWQLMMDMIPQQPGFEYLISSPDNPNDLNDPYFATFNLENTYLNFACNLAFEIPASLAWYESEFGDLSFADAVDKAVAMIITQAGSSDLAAAENFFLGAQSYYQQVALERVVRPGVSLEDATKVAMLSSVLYESVKSDAGPYGHVVNDFAVEVGLGGVSDSFGESLFV
ncbi:MAG: M10 family metallopeptidase [Rhizobiaceae bacterium]